MGGEGACLFVAHTHPLDPAFRNVVRDHVEGITHDAVTMLDARALQRLNNDLRDLLAHGSKSLWYLGPQHAPGCGIGLVGECEDLYAVAQADIVRPSRASALADGLDTGLEPIEDFPGSLVNGEYGSRWHPIKRRAEICVSLRRASLFQQ